MSGVGGVDPCGANLVHFIFMTNCYNEQTFVIKHQQFNFFGIEVFAVPGNPYVR